MREQAKIGIDKTRAAQLAVLAMEAGAGGTAKFLEKFIRENWPAARKLPGWDMRPYTGNDGAWVRLDVGGFLWRLTANGARDMGERLCDLAGRRTDVRSTPMSVVDHQDCTCFMTAYPSGRGLVLAVAGDGMEWKRGMTYGLAADVGQRLVGASMGCVGKTA